MRLPSKRGRLWGFRATFEGSKPLRKALRRVTMLWSRILSVLSLLALLHRIPLRRHRCWGPDTIVSPPHLRTVVGNIALRYSYSFFVHFSTSLRKYYSRLGFFSVICYPSVTPIWTTNRTLLLVLLSLQFIPMCVISPLLFYQVILNRNFSGFPISFYTSGFAVRRRPKRG